MEGETIRTEWRCRGGVELVPRTERTLALMVDGRELQPAPAPMHPALARCLTALNEGLPEPAVTEAVGGDPALAGLAFTFLDALRSHGLLVADLYWRELRLATLLPLVPDFAVPAGAASPCSDGPPGWRLSGFSLLRRAGGGWLLENTEASCKVAIEHPDVVLWLCDAETAAVEPDTPRRRLLGLLARLGFLENAGGGEPADRRAWEFHDRLFHTRTRPFGFLKANRDGPNPAFPRPPEIREPYCGEELQLAVPAGNPSRTLAEVMKSRRSRRAMGDPPVSLEQAAALLHRVARVVARTDDGYAFRPYPSAGGMHDLEFYLAVRVCGGLDPGFYHYRGDVHALTRLAGEAPARSAAAMIGLCATSWGTPDGPPQCLAVVSSRLPRMASQYEAIAYRNSLLGAGVVLQSLYLVAADLGLNGCAAGSGSSALFAEATGVSSWTETGIVEFGFGSAGGA